MTRMVVACALIVGVLVLPGAAGAQEGNGPYAPFPSVSENAPGDAWYALMDADISSARLADGAFAGALRPSTTGAASSRAGVEAAGTGPGPLFAALLLITFAIAAPFALRRLRKGRS